VPEWLLEPPPESKFLQKKQMVSKVPFLVKLIHNAQLQALGRKYEKFESKTSAELPPEAQERKLGRIAQKIKERQQ